MIDASTESVRWALDAAGEIRFALPPATVAEFTGRALPEDDRIALGDPPHGPMVPMGDAGFGWGSGLMPSPGPPEFSVGSEHGAGADGVGPPRRERPVQFLLGRQPLWLAHRLHGACELVINQLIVPQFTEFAPQPLSGDGAVMVVGVGRFGASSPLENTFAVLQQLQPDVVARTSRLAEEVIGRLVASLELPDEQSPIVGDLGLRHLSGAIAAAAAVVTADGGVLPDHPFDRVVMAVGLQVAAQLLDQTSVPPGVHAEGVRARLRSGYLLPRSSHVQQRLADGVLYVLEPGRHRPTASPSFAENGLVETVPGGFAVRCAEGPIQLNLDLLVHEEPPPSIHGHESVEFSWTAEIGGGRTPDVHEVMPPWPGLFRVRVTTHGRDTGMPHVGIAVWSAEQWEPAVVDSTDSLGAKLRGDDPAPEAPPVPYLWVRDTMLSEAATVTVVRGSSLSEVLRAFGADEAVNFDDRYALMDRLMEHAHVVLLPLENGVVAVEINQWQGSRPEVLGPASAGGPAASVYWSVNRSATLSLAEAGEFLVGEETMGQPQDPRIAALMPEADPEAYDEYGSFCFRALERFTGITLTPATIERAFTDGHAWTVLPQLEHHAPFLDVEQWFAEEQEGPVPGYDDEPPLPTRGRVRLLGTLEPSLLTDLAWELVGIAAAGFGVRDDTVVAEVLHQRGLTTRAELILRQSHADLNGGGVRAAVLEVARLATHPDPAAAVAAILSSHRWPSTETLRSMVAAFEARLPSED